MAATSFFGGEFFGGEFFNSGITTAVTTPEGAGRGKRRPEPIRHRRQVIWKGKRYWEDEWNLLMQLEADIARVDGPAKARKNAARRGKALPEVPKFEAGYVYSPKFSELPNFSAIIEQQRMIGNILLADLMIQAALRYLRRLDDDDEEVLLLLQ